MLLKFKNWRGAFDLLLAMVKVPLDLPAFINLSKLAREDVLIAAPHTSLFPALGRLRKDGSGYSWVPVVFTDQWDEKQ